MKLASNITDILIGRTNLNPSGIKSKFAISVFILMTVFSAVFAGTIHEETGLVYDAIDGIPSADSYARVYMSGRPSEIVTTTTDSGSPSRWYENVGALLATQWVLGDDHIVAIDKEINPGTVSRTGYYGVTNHTLVDAVDEYNDIVLRKIPIPIGIPGDNQANLNWAVATEDAGSPVRTNVAGYRILRSTSQTGPYTFLATVEGSTSYTDSTAINGTTYYYVIQLVYRVSAGTALTSLYYSANSNAVTPSAGGSAPTVTGVTPDTGVNTSTTVVTIDGTNFSGVTAVNIGTWPVDSYTVTSTTSITAVIPSGLPAATYHVTVTNAIGTSPTSSADQFTVTNGAPPGVIIIDDYEDPNPRNYYSSGLSAPTYSVTTAANHEGSKGIQVGYSYVTDWGGLVGGILPNNLDISSATGISFWVKGDGSSNTIRIDLKEATNEAPANGEVYSSTDISLSNTSWQKIELPYSAFVRNPYDGISGGNNTFDKNIFHYQLMYTGTNASAADHFVDYIVAETLSVSGLPTVTSVTPNTGTNDATTSVTIDGTNFGGTTAVKIGTWDVTSFTVDSALQISAVIPAGLSVNTYHITVTNGYGTSATSSADQFTVTAPVSTVPTVTGVTPDTGVNTSTTVVTIDGTNFSGVTAVNIGTWPVDSYTVTSTISITAVVPSGLPAATYHVTVTNGSGTSATSPADQFTVTSGSGSGLVIDDFEFYSGKDHRGMMDYYYESGSGVDEVTIPAADNSTTVVQEGLRSMVITYPGTIGTQWGGYWGGGLTSEVKDITPYTGVSLWVKGDGTSNTISISLLEADVAGITQETYASTAVTLTDTGWHEIEIPFSAFVRDPYGKLLEGTFSKEIKGYAISYRGADASVVQHHIDYIVAKNVSVSGLPTVTSVTPNTGTNDATTSVTIGGTNFGWTTAVKIGTWDVTSFTVDSALQISAVIPAGLPVNTYHVTVTNGYGTSATSSADQFTVTSPAVPVIVPTITGIDPDTGANTTSTEVTITGTNLDGATDVHIGTFEMIIVSVTPTEIVAIVPPGIPAGDYHITVTTPNGTSAETPNDIFTVTKPGVPVPSSDTNPPVISDVAFDGKLVLDGDFVGRTPVITALLTDDVAIDPSTIRVQLVNLYDTSSVPAVTFDPATGRMELVITSPLPYGENVFTINVSDTSGNAAEFRITLNGNDGNVFNYPNPFDPINGTTKIAFNISENTQVAIYLFDMTGRIVVRRVINATVGFNEYEWDGRDDYGTIASNGVYLLRLVSGNRLIGKTKVWVIKR